MSAPNATAHPGRPGPAVAAPDGGERRRLVMAVLALSVPAGVLAGAGLGGVAAIAVPVAVGCLLGLLGEVPLFLVILTAISGVGFYWVDAGFTIAGQGINLSGLHWGLVLVTSATLVLRRRPRTLPRPIVLYGAYLAVALLALLWTSAPFEGVKQWLLFLLPALVAWIVLSRVERPAEVRFILAGYWVAFAVAVAVAVGFWIETPSRGGQWTALTGGVGDRTLAIFLLPILALALGGLRHQSFSYLWMVGSVLLVGLATLSRTALAVMLVLLLLATTGMGRTSRLVVLGLSVMLAVGALNVEAFRGRFGGGDLRMTELAVEGEGTRAAFSVGGLDLSGRGWMWLQVGQHALERPLLGHGTGSATTYIRTLPRSPVEHPHNDYLRVFHDQGVVGLLAILLFGGGAALYFWRLHREATTPLAKQLALASYLATAAYGMIAFTDNPLVYASFFTQNVFMLYALAVVARRLERGEAGA